MTQVVHCTWATAAEEQEFSQALEESYARYLVASANFWTDCGDDWNLSNQLCHEYEEALEDLEWVWGLSEPEPEETQDAGVNPAHRVLVVREKDIWAAAHYRESLMAHEICWGLYVDGEEDDPFDKVKGKGAKQAVREALQAKTALKLLLLDLSDIGYVTAYCTPARKELKRLYKRFGFEECDGMPGQLVAYIPDVLDKLCRS